MCRFFLIGDGYVDIRFSLIMFAMLFIVVYFVCYFVYEDMLKKEKYTKISSLVLLAKKFDLDKKKMNYK